MARIHDRNDFYKHTARVIDATLRRDDSLFSPGRPIWSRAIIEDLRQRFVEHPDESSDRFDQKLKRQLSGAPEETTQLMGELLYLHLFPVLNASGATKRQLIDEVLSWAEGGLAMPPDLAEALDGGILHAGTAFNTGRPFQLWFLLEFLRAWKDLSPSERESALKDPWAFKRIASAVDVHSGYMQRNILLHLVHPDHFESISSREAKDRIARRFSDRVNEPTQDVDRQLWQIRQALGEKHGSDFRFHDRGIVEIWQPDPSKWGQFIYWARRLYEREDFDEQERDYKLLVAERLSEARSALASGSQDWVDQLKKALGPPNNLVPWQLAAKLRDWCLEDSAAAAETLRAVWQDSSTMTERIREFSRRLPDRVVRGVGTRTGLASMLHMAVDPTNYPPYRVTPFRKAFDLTEHDPPRRDADPAQHYEHALGFLDRLAEEASARGLDLRDRLDAQGLLWAITKSPADFMDKKEQRRFRKWRGEITEDEDGDDKRDGNGGNGDSREGLDPEDRRFSELAQKLHFEPEHLERIARLLESKGQVIFHGPPGTGKTYVARELAKFLTKEGGKYEIVQFHPSYAYEDFVEGYRPALLEGRPGFKLIEGPLKRIARQAADAPGQQFILVIDEINRGNLAKVFGELYFLLEYRREQINVQYSQEAFSLPENLWFIGTMNTADRSIALVDAALRRRFHFVPFYPDEPPVAGLLRNWLKENGKLEFAWIADVVERANEMLGNRHVAIGPSYFLRSDLDEQWIELIWCHSVLPYLQEQFFGEESRLADFDLKRLRKRDSSGAAEQETEATSTDATPEAD